MAAALTASSTWSRSRAVREVAAEGKQLHLANEI
jgi:hypothetical protein